MMAEKAKRDRKLQKEKNSGALDIEKDNTMCWSMLWGALVHIYNYKGVACAEDME